MADTQTGHELAKTTWEELLTQPVTYSQKLQVKNEADALTSGEQALSKLRRELGDDGDIAVKAILTMLIHDLVLFFNVGMTMNSLQCAQTVELILQQYFYFNIADFKVCFNRLKAGDYGQSYNRIDGQIILLALSQYSDTRQQAAEFIMQNKHKEQIQDEKTDYFYLKVSDGYLQQTVDNEYNIVEQKDATAFTEQEAKTLKKAIKGEKCTLEPANALLKVYAQLAKEIGNKGTENANLGTKTKQLRNIQIEMHRIRTNPNTSELEKTNMERNLAGLLPLTQAEYDQRNPKQ